jgi:hypothetical protein
MAWTTISTKSNGNSLTAAEWNSQVRDNLLLTEAGIATRQAEVETDPDEKTEIRPGTWFVATGSKALAERSIQEGSVSVDDTDVTTSTSYTNLDDTYGPSVTVVTGTAAIVMVTSEISNATANALSACDFDVSGATTRAASDTTSLMADGYTATSNFQRRSVYTRLTTLTAGTNTFTMKYKAGSGTAQFRMRQIVVWPV